MTTDLLSSLPPELADVAHRPGDEAYAVAATVYVRTGSPALVVRPRTAEQVAAAIQQAAAAGLPLSIRSGGHSVQAGAPTTAASSSTCPRSRTSKCSTATGSA